MNEASSIKDWQRMFEELTNSEKRDEAARKRAILKRREEKILDVGL